MECLQWKFEIHILYCKQSYGCTNSYINVELLVITMNSELDYRSFNSVETTREFYSSFVSYISSREDFEKKLTLRIKLDYLEVNTKQYFKPIIIFKNV